VRPSVAATTRRFKERVAAGSLSRRSHRYLPQCFPLRVRPALREARKTSSVAATLLVELFSERHWIVPQRRLTRAGREALRVTIGPGQQSENSATSRTRSSFCFRGRKPLVFDVPGDGTSVDRTSLERGCCPRRNRNSYRTAMAPRSSENLFAVLQKAGWKSKGYRSRRTLGVRPQLHCSPGDRQVGS